VRELTCAEIDESAPAYALDILDAGRRSLVASHLLRCGRCREMMSTTQVSADRLLDVDSSFERGTPYVRDSRFAGGSPLEEWAHSEPDWAPPRRRLRVAAAVFSVVALMVGTTLGPELEGAARPKPVPTLAVPLVEGSTSVGSVRVYAGQPPILEIEVTGLGGRQTLHVDLIDNLGHVEPFGSLRVVGGRADWASTEPRDMPSPKSLVLSDSSGKVLAQAFLS
jgi:hypothetical protein